MKTIETMKTSTRFAALSGAAVLLAAPLSFAAAPAHAEVDRHGACGNGIYELSADREGKGFEVDADIKNVAPFSQWTFVLRHDGKRFLKVTRTADNEGDVGIDAFRGNTAGTDTFAFKAKRVNGSARCQAAITVS